MDSIPNTVEREYHYSSKYSDFIGISFSAIFFGCVSLISLYTAATHKGGPMMTGRYGRIEEGPALVLLYSVGSLMGIAAPILIWLAWITFPRKQRIVFVSSGIILPRTRFSRDEQFVAFADISDIQGEEVNLMVVFLHFDCSQGHFSISRQKLKDNDFDEICRYLIDRSENGAILE